MGEDTRGSERHTDMSLTWYGEEKLVLWFGEMSQEIHQAQQTHLSAGGECQDELSSSGEVVDSVAREIPYLQVLRCSDIENIPRRKILRSDVGTLTARNVRLDPGKKNIITIVDANGVSVHHRAWQRTFESKFTRYRKWWRKNCRMASTSWKMCSVSAMGEAMTLCATEFQEQTAGRI